MRDQWRPRLFLCWRRSGLTATAETFSCRERSQVAQALLVASWPLYRTNDRERISGAPRGPRSLRRSPTIGCTPSTRVRPSAGRARPLQHSEEAGRVSEPFDRPAPWVPAGSSGAVTEQDQTEAETPTRSGWKPYRVSRFAVKRSFYRGRRPRAAVREGRWVADSATLQAVPWHWLDGWVYSV